MPRIAVILLGRPVRRREYEARLVSATELPGESTVRREVDHSILGQLSTCAEPLDLPLCCLGS